MNLLGHYFKYGFRNFFRQRTTSVINVLGLSAGISSFILILLFIQNELGYEKHIPESKDIYRLVEIQKPPGIEVQHVAITSGPWGPALKQNLPEVMETLRLTNSRGSLFRVADKVFHEPFAYYAESSVIRFFNIRLLSGSMQGILDEPNTAIISQRVAERFYGTSDAAGQSFRLGDTPYIINGVMENDDRNSHLHFEIILSFPTFEKATPDLANWGSNYLSTYVLLQPGTSREATQANIFRHMDTQMNEMGFHDAPRPDVYLQPMQDIHLKSNHIKFSIFNTRGDIILVYIFSLVAFLILSIACINYINLSTARATKRAMEVGMRKTLGASPASIFKQFMGESMIIAFFALVLSIGLVELFLPQFNATLNTNLKIDFGGNWIFNIGLAGLLVVVGLFAGAYPAFFMSRFQAINALKSKNAPSRFAGGLLRKILVIVQFAISAMLVFATLVFYNQWSFMRHHELGINYQNVVSLPLMQEQPDKLVMQQIKTSFLNHPAIERVALASGPNGVSSSQGQIMVAGNGEAVLMVRFGFVDEDFFPVMEIDIIHGRNFSPDYGTDHSQAVIINATAAHTLGWDQAVGKQFIDNWNPENLLTVIGVIKDYNFYSLHGEIEPAIFRILPERNRTILARIDPRQQQEALSHMQINWHEYFHDIPFEPVFTIENIKMQYQSEANTMRVITFFALLCIIISALGLYGLTAFMAEQKKKEIGIRRVLGESVLSIVAGMQKVFLELVVVALLIGLPLVYWYMERWLNNFAYRITLSFWHFVGSAAVVLVIAFLTVLSHSWRAAIANPVDSIKYE